MSIKGITPNWTWMWRSNFSTRIWFSGRRVAERFLREARLAARLNHASIVRVFDCGEKDGHYYIVMEFVDGQSIETLLQQTGALPVERALQIAESLRRRSGKRSIRSE